MCAWGAEVGLQFGGGGCSGGGCSGGGGCSVGGCSLEGGLQCVEGGLQFGGGGGLQWGRGLPCMCGGAAEWGGGCSVPVPPRSHSSVQQRSVLRAQLTQQLPLRHRRERLHRLRPQHPCRGVCTRVLPGGGGGRLACAWRVHPCVDPCVCSEHVLLVHGCSWRSFTQFARVGSVHACAQGACMQLAHACSVLTC